VSVLAALALSLVMQPAIIGADDRKPADAGFPWASVGKIQKPGFSLLEYCSGVLIAPGTVVTAAHCLVNMRGGGQTPAKKIHFLLGLNKDKFLAHGIATCAAADGDLPPLENPSADDFAHDVAVITFAPLKKGKPLALADGDIPPEAPLTHGGYGADRQYMPSVHKNCHVLWQDGPLYRTDCDAAQGQSGGPVLIEQNGVTKLAGIMLGGNEESTVMLPAKRIREFLATKPCSK
jgi:protease YdgD